MISQYPNILPTPTVPVASIPVLTAADLEIDVVVQFPIEGSVLPQDGYQLILNGRPVGNRLSLPDPLPPEGTILSMSIPTTEFNEDGIYTLNYQFTAWPGGTHRNSPYITIRIDRSALSR